MTKSYKLKLISGGASSSGKTSFLHGTLKNETPIGVSFMPIECFVNEGDSYKFILWDLKSKERFKFLFPTFCRGASAALLFFDVSNYNSFEELNYWINIFRKNTGKIPIILIGTNLDFNSREVFDEDIEKFIEKYHLDGLFFTSIQEEEDNTQKEAIFKYLVEKLDPTHEIFEFSVFFSNQMEDEHLENFLSFFSICPICKKENHFDYLKSFFLSKNSDLIKLRERLLKLVEESKCFNKRYYNNITLGIPCCQCYKNIFGKS